MLFWKRKRDKADVAKEAEIQAIRQETFKSADKATENLRQVNKLIEEQGGFTELFFLATGGARRTTKDKK